MDLPNDDDLNWPLFKFKTTVLTVIANLSWLMDEDYFIPITSFESKRKKTIKESDEISVFHKLIFFKPPNEREQFELESVKWIFSVGFKFFRRCPIEIQMALIKRSTYRSYGSGRWILKEGHTPRNMYLIVKGCVRVTKYIQDSVSKKIKLIEYCKLHEKQSFGESAVMFNTNRLISVQSLSTLEMISISKYDFMDVIKNNLQIQWDTNLAAIRNLSYFKNLNLMETNKCSTFSFIKTFQKHKYVLGNVFGDYNYGYFIIEGKINLILRLKIILSRNKFGNIVYELCDKKKLANKVKYKNIHMNICSFSSNSCFNIGEQMENKEFMATEETKCLCVPRWFMKKTEKMKYWSSIVKRLGVLIPNEKQVFDRYLAHQKENIIKMRKN